MTTKSFAPKAADRSLMGSSVVVVAGVTIIVRELVFEAGAHTLKVK